MGKIYGVHDSYCDLVGPSGGGPGAAKFCTCDSGKASKRIFEDADWQTRAEAYADHFIGQLTDVIPSAQLVKTRALLIATWKAAHPRAQTVDWDKERLKIPAAPPPAAPPVEDGPGEDDGPWSEGWGERAGEPGHREWYEVNRETIQMAHPDYTRFLWTVYKTQMGKLAASAASKSDAGKPKPFQFFMQQFPLGLKAVAAHMEKGCSDPGHVFLGWCEVENGFGRYTDAMLRHLLEEVEETVTLIDRAEGYDREWAEEQSAIAVAANAMIRLELLLRRRRNLNLDASASAC